ncbi:MAG: hypothetical protein FD125_830 [bacterium]|nr:MAG: hypothetical protein FD125_830 [bacterium]
MKRRILATAGFMLALVLAAGPVFAQESTEDEHRAFDRDCMDDYGRDLCDRERWSAIVSSFDVESAERVQERGLRGVRVFTVNGYSRDMPMIAVLHRGVHEYRPIDPVLEVRGPRDPERGSDAVVLRREAWFDLVDQAGDLQDLVSKAAVGQSKETAGSILAGEDEEVIICLHAWVTVTESLTDRGVERRIRNACGDDPLFEASYNLSVLALRGFPHCNHLDPGNYRNESTQLQACLILEGEDRIAAAEVLTILQGLWQADWEGAATHMSGTIRLQQANGPSLEGPDAVAAMLTTTSPHRTRLYFGSATGASNRVVVTGDVGRYGETDEFAGYEMVWVRTEYRWHMEQITIGPFQELRREDN